MYRARIEAKTGTLLGGVKTHTSGWLVNRDDAQNLAETYRAINVEAGRDVSEATVDIGPSDAPK